jgi:hypothetical protein
MMGGGNLLGGRAICVVDLCVCVCVGARERGRGVHARRGSTCAGVGAAAGPGGVVAGADMHGDAGGRTRPARAPARAVPPARPRPSRRALLLSQAKRR